MKKILLPTDFSQTSVSAIQKGIKVAKAFEASITLLHVEKTKDFTSFFSSDSKNSPAVENPEEKMKELVAGLKDNGVSTYNFEIRQGKIHREVVTMAKEGNYDLIIMGTHGISGFEEFWMGSNSYRVVSASPCPVLTMRAIDKDFTFKKIVLPIDTSSATRHKVPFTMSFARCFDSEVHVVGACMDKSEEFVFKVKTYTSQVAKYLTEHGINVVEDTLFGNNITKMTIDYAEKINADLISIMTEQEVDPANLILGPYAQQMVNHSQIPVLSVRPREDIESITAGY